MRQNEKRREEKRKEKVNQIDEKYYDHQQGPIRPVFAIKPQIAENNFKEFKLGNLQPKNDRSSRADNFSLLVLS